MRVNTDELQRQASELQAAASRMNDIQDSVLRIARNLSREQFGEKFRYPLNQAAVSIGKRSEELRKMRSALRQISQLYERTEIRVTDEAEHACVHHEQSAIGTVYLPDISGGFLPQPAMLGPGGQLRVVPGLLDIDPSQVTVGAAQSGDRGFNAVPIDWTPWNP